MTRTHNVFLQNCLQGAASPNEKCDGHDLNRVSRPELILGLRRVPTRRLANRDYRENYAWRTIMILDRKHELSLNR